ncbi:MAG TPA: phosphoketolase family protein [Thermoanaerobaculia bacterium]|nr:phosphoketolase family protein [Thermoanaerobaculia bacterium]
MLSASELAHLRLYRRAVDFLAAAQIYLQANPLLREPLRPEHCKSRLLGHWGTVPGINLIYAHLNRLIRTRQASVLLITGPGHGAPANFANLYLEGSLGERYPELTLDEIGLCRMVKGFSWPGGFPSHLNPATPGVIHEGGELGYALATAFGAALDNPDLLVACIVGDGEAETGPTATAWHGTKYLDPATCGAVLPILHDNGYKISSATVSGRMSDAELDLLYRGYGWAPRIVGGGAPAGGAREAGELDPPALDRLNDRLDEEMAAALDWAHEEIQAIQRDARGGRRRPRPAWPLLVLRSPKGMGCPASWRGEPLAGTWRAHQVPVAGVREDPEALATVERWLRSYRPEELFDAAGRPVAAVLGQCPTGDRRMGMSPHANGGALLRDLDLPPLGDYGLPLGARGHDLRSAMQPVGAYLRDTFRRSEAQRNFRLVCPDELTSNKLEKVFEATSRDFEWPLDATDRDLAPGGRVLEMLSEHMCQGWLEGYLLTGRHGLFPCYEAFIAIVDGMVNQYAKFLKQSRETPWRRPIASLNYLLTSDGWRQDHNGYSHQGPGFINMLLNKKGSVLRIYLPPDANTLLVTLDHCLKSRDYINLVIATKNEMPQWLSLAEAAEHGRAGASTWRWASSAGGEEPDVVLAAAGNTPTLETLAAAWLLARDAPGLRVRVVNVVDLLVLDTQRAHPHGMSDDSFAALFPRDREVIFAFHGYPSAVHQLLFSRPAPQRFHVFGYIEEGTTTTPFDMTVRNGISRYQLAIEALRRSPRMASLAGELIDRYEYALREHRVHIETHGSDPEEIAAWRWS